MKTTQMKSDMGLGMIGALVMSMVVGTGNVHAATYTWDGGGTDNKISTAKNWVGDAVSMGSHDYVFGDSSLRAIADSGSGGSNRDIGKYTLTGNGFSFVHSGAGSLRLMAPTETVNVSLEVSTDGTNTFDMARVVMKDKVIGTGTGRVVFNSFVSWENSSPQINCPATFVFQASGGNGSGSTRTFVINGSPTILVNNTSGSGLGFARLNLNTGTLGGSGILAPGDASNICPVTVAAGARLSPGANAGDSVGTLTFAFANASGRLIFNSGALFTFDLATPAASDKIAVTAGGVTLNSQQFTDFTFNALSGFTVGTYTLIESVATTGSLGAVKTGTINGLKSEIKLVGNNLVLEVKSNGTLVMFM